MTFTEWYEETNGHKWNEDYALLNVTRELDGYEKWCKDNDKEPIWDG